MGDTTWEHALCDAREAALRTQLDEAVRLLRSEHDGRSLGCQCSTCAFLSAAALNKEAGT